MVQDPWRVGMDGVKVYRHVLSRRDALKIALKSAAYAASLAVTAATAGSISAATPEPIPPPRSTPPTTPPQPPQIPASSGAFTVAPSNGTGLGPIAAAVGDFNGDGKSDLA